MSSNARDGGIRETGPQDARRVDCLDGALLTNHGAASKSGYSVQDNDRYVAA